MTKKNIIEVGKLKGAVQDEKVTINNVSMPAIGIGTWNIGNSLVNRSTEIKAIQTAIDAGAQAIDTAEMYGDGRSEALVAEAIKPYNREKLFLIDKVLPSNASKTKLEHSLGQSLEAVGTDYFDLYLLHWRGGIPLAETVNELERVKKAGKIKAWGVSNFDVSDLEELWRLKMALIASLMRISIISIVGELNLTFFP